MWDLLSFLKGKDRLLCLNELSEGPKTPAMIVESSGKNLSHISRALKELEEKGLVECKNPEASKNRFYVITQRGEQVLRKFHSVHDDS